MDINDIFNKKPLFATRAIGTELILVPIKKSVADMNELFTLNEVGNFIWGQIDGKKSIEDICTTVTDEFEIDAETAEKDVYEFLSRLSELMKNS